MKEWAKQKMDAEHTLPLNVQLPPAETLIGQTTLFPARYDLMISFSDNFNQQEGFQ